MHPNRIRLKAIGPSGWSRVDPVQADLPWAAELYVRDADIHNAYATNITVSDYLIDSLDVDVARLAREYAQSTHAAYGDVTVTRAEYFSTTPPVGYGQDLQFTMPAENASMIVWRMNIMMAIPIARLATHIVDVTFTTPIVQYEKTKREFATFMKSFEVINVR